MAFKVRDKVILTDLNGTQHDAEIININEFRESSKKYCVYIPKHKVEVFVPESALQLKGGD